MLGSLDLPLRPGPKLLLFRGVGGVRFECESFQSIFFPFLFAAFSSLLETVCHTKTKPSLFSSPSLLLGPLEAPGPPGHVQPPGRKIPKEGLNQNHWSFINKCIKFK